MGEVEAWVMAWWSRRQALAGMGEVSQLYSMLLMLKLSNYEHRHKEVSKYQLHAKNFIIQNLE
jgi:hypothetical protein